MCRSRPSNEECLQTIRLESVESRRAITNIVETFEILYLQADFTFSYQTSWRLIQYWDVFRSMSKERILEHEDIGSSSSNEMSTVMLPTCEEYTYGSITDIILSTGGGRLISRYCLLMHCFCLCVNTLPWPYFLFYRNRLKIKVIKRFA